MNEKTKLYEGGISELIDFGQLLELAPEEFEVARNLKRTPDNYQTYETAMAGFRGSHYDHLVDRCISTVIMDLQCRTAPFTTADLFRQINLDPCDGDYTRFCERIPKKAPEMCCEEIDEPATWVHETMTRRCWTYPPACRRSLAYGLHKDLECWPGARAAVVSDIEAMIDQWLGELAERERISVLFGLPQCTTCSTNAASTMWNYEGLETEQYQFAGGGLWTNAFYDINLNPMFNCDTADKFFCRIEGIWRNLKNWNTCDPVECDGTYNLFTVGDCQEFAWQRKVGAHQLTTPVNDGCGAGETQFQVPQRPGWSLQFKRSRWARECLVDYYLNNTIEVVDPAGDPVTITPAANQATAEYRADNTFLLSRSFTDSFAAGRIPNETRTISGTNHMHYFSQGYTDAKRIFWGYKYFPLRPWLTAKILGFDATFTAT